MTGPASFIPRAESALDAYLGDRAAALSHVGDELTQLTEAARAFVLVGGKRLRPLFAYWGWRTVRTEDDDDSGLVTAAASLELLHACALVHDDLMDASSTRRGKPSVHTAFAAMHREQMWTGDAEVFGASAAILLGDLLLCWADSLFVTASLPPETSGPIRRVWDDMREVVMAGQYLDVLVQARGAYSATDALRVAKYKTSKYTVEGPLHFGAAAAGAPASVFATLSAYGLALGEAFQLRDDVLGTFGDPGRTGKPAGDDLREGKQTLLVALTMERADPAQARLLRAGLGDRTLRDEQAEELCELIVATGALDEVEARISERADQARAALDPSIVRADARAALTDLAIAATQRHN